MRRWLVMMVAVVGCSAQPPATGVGEPALPAATATASAPPPATSKRTLSEDAPSTTVAGNTFIAPRGWSIEVRGKATILEAPEGGSWIAIVDVAAKTGKEALAAAWAAYRPDAAWPLKATTPSPDKDGWEGREQHVYQTSPNEKRSVVAGTMRHGDRWTVWIYDMADAVGEKRLAAVQLVFGRLYPKGYERESFAGRKAHVLDEARIGELKAFVERAQEALRVPGVSIGLVQGGKTVFAGGFGVREIGKAQKVDEKTLYIIASNTKAMTTLMLGKLVDDGKLTWETPVTSVFPQFKLGDAETTSKVQIKHLVCACTGLPRQDFEWLLEFGKATPSSALATLGSMQPTSKFGEMFQYSNPLAAAGGYVGAYVIHPKRELGAGYDEAMKTQVFDPLGMTATTFDFNRALRGNHAAPHALDIDGKPAPAAMEVNHAIVAVRPAGGAWSNVEDMLEYVSVELAGGMLPNGKRYVSQAVLDARKVPQVTIGKDHTYGMGLGVSTKYDIPVVSHGGSMIGYKSNMFWLPDHGIGAVILTNADPGGVLQSAFGRKLLEVVFDGKPEADNDVAVAAKATAARLAAERKLLVVPADATAAGELAESYDSEALGEIAVSRAKGATVFDFGEWKSEVASRNNPDGTTSFVTVLPGLRGLDFVAGKAAGKKTLTFRDAQHEYVFTEK